MLSVLLEEGEDGEHETIAIVTHKGWLREFERGPLQRPAAEEFGNLECRVFRIEFGAQKGMGARPVTNVTRLHPPEAPADAHDKV